MPRRAARLTGLETTVFTEMTALAARTGAINLGQGFPDTDGPSEVLDAAVAALRGGPQPVRPAAGRARRCARRCSSTSAGCYGLEPEDVLITFGATEGIAAALLALCDPGDEVVVLEPYYDSYAACIGFAGATRRPVTLRPPEFALDPEALRAAIGPRARVMLLNSPHNPTGRVLDALRARARSPPRASSTTWSASATRSTSTWSTTAEHIPPATLPGMAERTLTISSVGKSFSFTGWKIGWCSGPAELVAATRTVKQYLTFAGGTPLQHAAAAALRLPPAHLERLRDDLRRKRDQLCAGLDGRRPSPAGPGRHLLRQRRRRHRRGRLLRRAARALRDRRHPHERLLRRQGRRRDAGPVRVLQARRGDRRGEPPAQRLGCQNASSPAVGALTTLRQPAGPSRGSSSTRAPSRARPLGGLDDLGHLDVGQPQRLLDGALDDAAADPRRPTPSPGSGRAGCGSAPAASRRGRCRTRGRARGPRCAARDGPAGVARTGFIVWGVGPAAGGKLIAGDEFGARDGSNLSMLMATRSTGTGPADPAVLAAARAGDERAFARLVEPHRGELHAHCYRMLGSVHDADDALQETLLRAWRGLSRFQERSSLRSWLYTIATNTSLTQISRRPKRVLPIDYAPATDPHVAPGPADRRVGVARALSRRDARRRRRLRRARGPLRAARERRAGVRRRAPAPVRQPARGADPARGAGLLRQGDRRHPRYHRGLGQQRAAARPRLGRGAGSGREPAGDPARRSATTSCATWSTATSTPGSAATSTTFASMLAEEATFAMPPLATWYSGRDAIRKWATTWPMSGAWRWRAVLTRANGQPALGLLRVGLRRRRPTCRSRSTCSLSRGGLISDVTAFIVRATEATEPEAYERFPEQPADPRQPRRRLRALRPAAAVDLSCRRGGGAAPSSPSRPSPRQSPSSAMRLCVVDEPDGRHPDPARAVDAHRRVVQEQRLRGRAPQGARQTIS